MEQYRNVGNSNVLTSPIAFGAWAIGGWMWGGADENDAIKAVRLSYDFGITTIDTAPIYGFGKSEELVGEAMKDIPRDKYQIFTKYGLSWSSNKGEFYFETTNNQGNRVNVYKYSGKEAVIQECENSLRRLRTDYIDLYQIHWPDVTTPVEETMEAVSRLLEQGKIRAAGVCNYDADLVEEALKTVNIVSNQVPYSLLKRSIEKQLVPQTLEKGIGILAYSPLQRGLLTGKIKPDHVFADGDTREGSIYYTPENIKRANDLLEKIKPIAEAHKATLSQVVINWTIRQPGIACALVGARNEQQVRDNVKALDFNLSKDELALIDKASREFVLSKE
jgi:aryl-alcohol dehydrogenase-like predicted oxidoreductase